MKHQDQTKDLNIFNKKKKQITNENITSVSNLKSKMSKTKTLFSSNTSPAGNIRKHT